MAGLRCGEVSPLAFATLRDLVDGYVAVDDTWCRAAMKQLARPEGTDPALAVGTSGAAGLAALLALAAAPDSTLRERLGLTASGRVMAIATEGVTEPELWREIVRLKSQTRSKRPTSEQAGAVATELHDCNPRSISRFACRTRGMAFE